MAIPNFIYDGVTAFGTTGIDGTQGTVTIGSTTYVVEEQSIAQNYSTASDKTGTGQPGRFRFTKQPYTGTMTLQLAAQTTAYPAPGATFLRTLPNEASAVSFFVLGAPYELTNSETGIRTCKINVQSVTNAITTA